MSPADVRALIEVGLLAVLAGTLGPWIVLRRYSFFTHATGTATFPGLVVAGPWGLATPVAALGSALVFALGLGRLNRRLDPGAATGVLLVGMLAVGTILASDVYESGGGVDVLLVGSLAAITTGDLVLTAAVAVAVLVADVRLRRTWAAATFDPSSAGALGVASRAADLALVIAIGAAAVIAVDAVGALLAGVVLVVPAATVRLMTDELGPLRVGATVLAAAEGTAALHLANRFDIGAGPALAVLGGVVFAAVSVVASR